MKKNMHRIALLSLTFSLAVLGPTALRAGVDEARTAAFVAKLQNSDGGFSLKGGDPSTLGATSNAIRSLKNVGGSIPDVPSCIAFVKACRDQKSGGFAQRPGGEANVPSTAVGLMTLDELKLLEPALVDSAIAYQDSHVNGFEDVRIAVAGLEAAKAKSQKLPEWIAAVQKLKNPDGTFGSRSSLGRDTGGAVVALLRMGEPPGDRSAILDALRKSQRPDGGWGKEEGPSTLDSTYRVMRAFYMLKEEPNLSAVKTLVASCRSSEGGYGTAAGRPADLQGTYYATTVLRWVRELEGEPALLETAGFRPLFNGKDLDGWEGDKSIWTVRDGVIVGKTEKLDHNDFLASKEDYGDFVMKATFKLKNGAGNSGIMFRAKRLGSHEMSGYQADVGENYWGSLYDESRRNKTLVAASKEALAKIHPSSWNHYVIRAMGKTISLNLNGVESVRYREDDATIPDHGVFGLQVHAGGPTEVLFKDLYIQRLPSPKEDGSHAFGFHLKTIKVGNETRKYTFFVPKDYDGSTPTGVVLFLHGSGERGEDGVVPAQVGLGPAIMQKPEAFPLIAVFPQAKTTWSGDSEDAKAALAALNDVVANFMVDPRAIVLTGLSMGGAGAWEIAAAHPDLFAGVAPVCGNGKVESAEKLEKLPCWCFVGDSDRDETVMNTRAMASALKSLGAQVRSTEYRGVGHNSWDRAYNDPDLLQWFIGRRRTH